MEVAILLLTAVSTFFVAIPALQALGMDVRIFGRLNASGNQTPKISSVRWWLLLLIAVLGFVGSITGLILHAVDKPIASSTDVQIVWQKPITSADPRFPFGLEIGIETEKEYTEPAQLLVTFDGDIGDAHGIKLLKGGDLQAVNEAIMAPPVCWFHPDVYNIKWLAPLWKPNDPLVIRFYSKNRIRAKYVVPLIFRSNVQ
jgi:hypothetical protein